MANHTKAKHHHAKAGEAFQRGDMKLAAHHMGHALSALRSAAPTTNQPEPDAAEMGGPADGEVDDTPPVKISIRDRLKGFKKP